MKKFLSIVACFMLIIVAGVTLASCGEAKAPVRLASTAEINEVKFTNNSSLKIKADKDKENTYIVTGKADKVSAEQAKLWGDAYKDDVFVIVEIDLKAGAKAEYTGIMGDSKTTKNDTDKDDVLQMIRLVRKDQNLTVKITEKDAPEATTYTIVFDLDNFKDAE